MTTTANLMNELSENLKGVGVSQYGAMIKKTLGLGNSPDCFTSEGAAASSAKNQAKTTKQTVEILVFLKPKFYAVAATNRDCAIMKRAGFNQQDRADGNGNLYSESSRRKYALTNDINRKWNKD